MSYEFIMEFPHKLYYSLSLYPGIMVGIDLYTVQLNIWLTCEHVYRFELHGSTYTWIFFLIYKYSAVL